MSFVANRRDGSNEPTLPLINIVFLMLIFFLVAAQVARPLDADLSLVQTDDPDVIPPSDALVLHDDGRLTWLGSTVTIDEGLAAMRKMQKEEIDAGQLRIMPDRDAPALELLKIARAAHTSTAAQKIMIMTEKSVP
ncbi:biopolymer transporter ExbD [Pacificibacter sp. AS14]|uniref:ExbD/TolR family protein n=1 Tax=Pacificibacter sp. AS14 TaxID=3135785 RepID=UPI00316AF316